MTHDELTAMTIAEAAARIARREVSPLELADAYLGRIARLDPAINAYITVTADRARADARRAADEIARGGYRGRLHGIPLAYKDLFDTAGIRTTAGSKILADNVPAADATVVRKLADAGAVLLGKLNTHEFAYGATTENPHYGATHNPWDLDRIPAGSSGGSGAAVAAHLAAAALGTDTGGSIRMPASVCGVVGLMPTYGRVSKAGVFPLSVLYDHAGPLARTVEDAAIMLTAIAGYDPDDQATVPVPVPDYTVGIGDGIRGLRVGVLSDFFFDALDADVATAVEAAIPVLRGLGADVRDVSVEGLQAAILEQRNGYLGAEARQVHAGWLATRPDDYGADVRYLLSMPYQPDVPGLLAGLRRTEALAVKMRNLLEEVDVIVTPTTAIPATRIGQQMVTLGGRETNVTQALAGLPAIFNQVHIPALSVPCGFTPGGLPIGLQFAARPFAEALLLRAGHAYEQATEWHKRAAPVG